MSRCAVQIIVPMSGVGERFLRARYSAPKPLIEIDGKPVIAHVIDMFPGEKDFIFICNQDHLANRDYQMESILQQYCPTGQIIGIAPHKLGPVHAVCQVEHLIDLNQPVVVNYCDFTCYWDWHHFKKFVRKTGCTGAIPAYKGFHPHTLGTTNYAYIREADGWVQDIQEKQPYTNNRMQEFASSGTYYFASGKIMSRAFGEMMEQDLNVGGEYYVSLAYKTLLAENQPVAVYPLQHFMQWGTPEDVAEYNNWLSVFRRLISKEPLPPQVRGSLIIPMAGLGQRFIDEEYSITKPLIQISGKAMAVQATHDLPSALHQVFVLRSDMPRCRDISDELEHVYPNAIIETVPGVTEGQACTALVGLNALERNINNAPGPVTFGACDNGVMYDKQLFNQLSKNLDIDVIVWGIRGHVNAARFPHMFGWIDAKDGRVRKVSVKVPLKSPQTDPIAIGTFTFRRAKDFRRAVQRLISRDGRVNNEFYIDSCINDAIDLGMRCDLFEADCFLSWGTPNDLRTFEYWQSCFHKWIGHPYRLELDNHIPQDALPILMERYQSTVPQFPRINI